MVQRTPLIARKWNKVLLPKKIENLLGVMNWDPKAEDKTTFDSLFDWN